MRIAIVVDQFPVVSETFILNQITGLIDRGHDVDILAECREDTNVVHEDVGKYALLERTRYSGPVLANYIVRLAKGLSLLLHNANRNLPLLARSLNVFKYGRQAASLRMLYRAASLVGAGPYDIIHCHFGPNGLLGVGLRNAGVLRGRLVTSFHGHDFTRYVASNGNRVYDALFKHGDFFLPVSQHCRDTLIRLGCAENKMAVHHMGVDCYRLAFSPVRPPKSGPIRIVSIARFVEKKGLEYGIRAMAKVIDRYPDVEYDIIGDGPLWNRCARLIEELATGAKVHLQGWKDRQETYSLLRKSHIFLCPSVTSVDGDKEGIPVVLMEAMAIGLPVVTSWHSGIPELVQDGISGLLVAERDVDGLADRLLYLLEHPEMWPGMGRAGREFVEKNYDMDKLNDRLVDIFRGLL